MTDTSTFVRIDAEHPWPWLDAFPEYAASFFHGRDEDSEALLRCVFAAPVTVLFGKSGLGKSSLLQAGLFPRLRQERLLPVYVRLNHGAHAPGVSEQITRQFHAQLKASLPQAYEGIVQHIQNAASEPLWMQLHHAGFELRDGAGRRWTPVFVLDQFEEIFTLGAADLERQQQLFYELGDLMENRIPKALAERLHADADGSLYEKFNLDTQHYRFLLSLREDYLPDLEEWTGRIPRLGANRYRLLPMVDAQAVDAVIKTGGKLVTSHDAQNIVHYLTHAQADLESNAPAMQRYRRRVRARVEPALLSLICSGLNAERLAAKKTRLKTDNLAKEGGLIVERFYDTAFTGLPESVRDFIEQCLITADGVRLPYPVLSIENEQLVTTEQIQKLIDKRLIRRENHEDGDRIELVHDRLAQIALQRRQAGEQRKETLRQQKALRRWMAGIVIFVAALIGFAGFMFDARQQALEAKTKAQQAWLDATAMRLAAEGGAMTSGSRAGGTIQGLFKVLAGHRLSRSANTDEALQSEYRKHAALIFVSEHPSVILSVAFSPDGSRIVSGSRDNTLRLWDTETGKPVGEPMRGHEERVSSVAFSPDGRRIVSGSWDKTLRLWDTETGKPVGEPMRGHEERVSSVAFSPDGRRIVSGSWDKTLRLWDTETGKPVGEPMRGHEERVSSVTFSPDGSRIVSGSRDNTLRLWDAETGKPVGEPMRGHEWHVLSVTFSPDGSRIVSRSEDNTLRLWDTETGKPVGEPLRGHANVVLSVAFSPDGSRIVSGSEDRTLRLWDTETGKPVGEPLRGYANVVLSVAFSPDGSRIVSGSSDRTLRLWDAETGKAVGEPLRGHANVVSSVAFSPDGRRIVSGSSDKTLRLWDAETGKPVGEPMRGHEWHVLSVAFSPDGRRIVSGSSDNTLRLWDTETGKPIGEPLRGHEGAVSSVAFSPDGRRIVSGSGDKTLRLWDTETGKPMGEPMSGHERYVSSVAFSPDGSRIVSGSEDKTLRLWDAETGKSVGEPMRGHERYVWSVAFSPDGSRIVSGSEDSTLRLWDTETGKPVGEPMRGHEWHVLSVAFSPDGSRIASGSSDKTLRRWVVFEGWADALCRKLGRNMSYQEWQEWISSDIAYIEQCPGLPIPPDE